MEHLKEKYYGGHDAAAEAFEELWAMVENINVSSKKTGSKLKKSSIFAKIETLNLFCD